MVQQAAEAVGRRAPLAHERGRTLDRRNLVLALAGNMSGHRRSRRGALPAAHRHGRRRASRLRRRRRAGPIAGHAARPVAPGGRGTPTGVPERDGSRPGRDYSQTEAFLAHSLAGYFSFRSFAVALSAVTSFLAL